MSPASLPEPSRLTRRALLFSVAGVALAGCARPSTQLVLPTASPAGTPRDQLSASMAVFAQNTELFGVSVHDRRTGMTFGHNADFTTQSASIAKVMIVLLALRKARAAGEELTFEQYGLASQAIVNSDNDSADALWEWVGGPRAYTALAADLGLSSTRADDRSDFWSWTNTTPTDQNTLIDLIVDGSPALNVDDRLYLLDLMGRTNPSQTWGIGNPRGSKVDVQMKNGWVHFKSVDNLWGVNSIGRVAAEGVDYSAAIMCRMSTFDEGRALVDAVGATLFTVLKAGELR